eukprot:19430-Heterococcus_DN1.PRE.1
MPSAVDAPRHTTDALLRFSGDTLLHAGETGGDTGTPQFEQELARNWVQRQPASLPCFSNTAASLTVYDRRSSGSSSNSSSSSSASSSSGAKGSSSKGGKGAGALLRCATCSVTGATGGLKRCRLTRAVCYCSEACRKADEQHYGNLTAVRHIRPSMATVSLHDKKLFAKVVP